MHIDKKLNIVIPILRGDKTVLYIHAEPIRRETFEVYHLVLAKTFSAFAQNGLDPRSGPSVAGLILKDVAKATSRYPGMDWWEGHDGVGGPAGLIAEMTRLSNAVVPSNDKGWTTLPLETAFNQGLVSDDEKSEVQNLLAFFTVTSATAPRVDRAKLVEGMAVIYELQTTSLNSTEFGISLKTPTTAENTGANAQA